MPKLYYLFITLLLSLSTAYAQDTAPKQIEIVYAGTLTIDNDKYPGATIFNSDDQRNARYSSAIREWIFGAMWLSFIKKPTR